MLTHTRSGLHVGLTGVSGDNDLFFKTTGFGAPRGPSPVGAGVNLCTYVCVCFREEAETHTHTRRESLIR